ncbi:MAG: sulfatase-like hydrolase/transferase [Algibacter sp.]
MYKRIKFLALMIGIFFIGIFLISFKYNSNIKGEIKKKIKPNVIFVFTDDQRFNSLGITGEPVTETPNIDKLANDGVFFNQAFITSPICGPSRANIFTGQWERKNKIGFTSVSNNFISEAIFNNSWQMQMKNAGYSTAFIGKHHTKIADRGDTPLKKGIDFCYFGNGHLGFYPAKKHKVFSNLKNKTQVEGLFEATEAFLKQGDDTDYFFENADSSLKNRLKKRDPNKPFSVWINFNLPHASSIGGMGSQPTDPPFYSTLYNDKKDKVVFPEGYPTSISLPENVYATSDLMTYYVTSNKEKLLNEKLKMDRAVYAIDQFVGNLRELLKSIHEDENTIIVFCSDNGLFLGEHGLGGKTILYDESVHVPLIVYSPFLNAGKKRKQIDHLVVGQDIPATILDMCDLKIPNTYQGKSMLPLIEEEDIEWRKEIFLENLFTDQGYPRQEGVRSYEFKYIRSFSKENDRKQYVPKQTIETNEAPIYEELFDIVNDPKEQNNLVLNPIYKNELNYFRDKCNSMVKELY